MATHSSILAWRMPCIEEPGRPHTVRRVTQSGTTEVTRHSTKNITILVAHIK